MRLEPTRREARWLVALLVAYWVVGSALTVAPTFAMFLVAFALGASWFWTLFGMAGRCLGHTRGYFLVGLRAGEPGTSWWRRGKDANRVLLTVVDPRWWHTTVAPATGWSVILVDVLLAMALVGVVAVALFF